MEKVKKDLVKVTILKSFEQFEQGQSVPLPIRLAKALVNDGFAEYEQEEAPKTKVKAPKK